MDDQVTATPSEQTAAEPQAPAGKSALEQHLRRAGEAEAARLPEPHRAVRLLQLRLALPSPRWTISSTSCRRRRSTACSAIRQHLRHHHRRHRSFGRHADDLLRGDDRRVPDLLGPAAVGRGPRRDRDRRASAAAISGILIAKLKIPPFIATLGMMWAVKGLSLVVSGTKPIYFNDTPELRHDFSGVADRLLRAERADSQRRPDPVRRSRSSPRSSSIAPRSGATPSRSAATRRRRGFRASTSTRGKSPSMPDRRDHRRRRPDHRLTPQFGPARARPGLRARGDRRRGHRRHVAEPAEREPSSAPSSAPSS